MNILSKDYRRVASVVHDVLGYVLLEGERTENLDYRFTVAYRERGRAVKHTFALNDFSIKRRSAIYRVVVEAVESGHFPPSAA